jgi:hypothetical protein
MISAVFEAKRRFRLKERICRGFLDRLIFTAIWLPVGALGVYAKATIFRKNSGVSSRALFTAQPLSRQRNTSLPLNEPRSSHPTAW